MWVCLGGIMRVCRYMGQLNIFISTGQLLDTWYCGLLAQYLGWNWVLGSGVLWGAAAVWLLLRSPLL